MTEPIPRHPLHVLTYKTLQNDINNTHLKIEVESELESLRAEVDYLADGPSLDVAERSDTTVDNVVMEESRVRLLIVPISRTVAHDGRKSKRK